LVISRTITNTFGGPFAPSSCARTNLGATLIVHRTTGNKTDLDINIIFMFAASLG
jgi:hypothetical protein